MTLAGNIVSVLLAGALVLAPSAAAAESEARQVLAPSTPWNLDYGLESCTLSRNFGTKDGAISLYLTQTHPGPWFDLSLAGQRLGKARSAAGTTLRFGDQAERNFKDTVWVTPADDGRPVLLLGSNTFSTGDETAEQTPPATSAELRAIDRFALAVSQTDPFELATGPMDKPMAALQQCEDDLVRTWGFDPAQLASLSKQPEPLSNPATWISPDSYPRQQVISGGWAILYFRIVVGPTGRAESCTIQRRVGDRAFAESACKQLMVNAQFTPALNASGEPVRALWFNSARYQTGKAYRLF